MENKYSIKKDSFHKLRLIYRISIPETISKRTVTLNTLENQYNKWPCVIDALDEVIGVIGCALKKSMLKRAQQAVTAHVCIAVRLYIHQQGANRCIQYSAEMSSTSRDDSPIAK